MKKGTQRLTASKKKQNYSGEANAAVRYLINDALLDKVQWKKFVDQFREQRDGTNGGWRGEYWGKMIRGAIFVYEYARDEELYEVLTETVKDLLTTAEQDGRVSSYSKDTEFRSWDVWSRKYVLLGMEYFYEICRDEELKSEIVSFMRGCADYIIAHLGMGEGKMPITEASSAWYGLNSSSILEPMVKLYNITGDEKYFDYATYIIEEGGALGINIFELALENKVNPYQYGVSKAYEMISCFEGIIEYYLVTGIEKYRTMAENFGSAVMATELSVIGSCGCTHELFDHTSARQTAKYEGAKQETCVTVTWMKYCGSMLRLTGDSAYADCMEKSFFNAYLGALNTEHCHSNFIESHSLKTIGIIATPTFLPFDSYSPLTPNVRGHLSVGGVQFLSDYSYYGCCACIGAAGVGVYLGHAVLESDDGIVVNFFEEGETALSRNGKNVTVGISTDYPRSGRVALTIKPETSIETSLMIRIPGWSENTAIASDRSYKINGGYAVFEGVFDREEVITLDLDMSVRVSYPEKWDTDEIYTDMKVPDDRWYVAKKLFVQHMPEDDDYVSLSRGPITLAADEKLGKDPRSAFSFKKDIDTAPECRLLESRELADGLPCIIKCELASENGEAITLVDYASAGRRWDSVIAAWLPTK